MAVNTRSYAVTGRLRDASCLSVVPVIPGVQSFISSYFGIKFTVIPGIPVD